MNRTDALRRNETLIRHKLRQYLLPGIMLTAALQIGNIVDTMLVGSILGPEAMSAVKIGMAVDNVMEIPGYVLGVGGSVAAGILLGRREREKANRVFSATFFLSLLLGLCFAALSVLSPRLAGLLTGGSDLAPGVSRFVRVTLLGAPIISIALQFISYVAVDNNPSVASAYVICSNVINLAFDYLLLTYTPLGTAGAALSTVLGYGLGMLILLRYLRSEKRMLRLVNPFPELKEAISSALLTGVPTLLFMVFTTLKDVVLNSLIVRMIGSDAMASYTVCANVSLLVELLVGGIIGTVSSIGSVLYGEKDYFGLRSIVRHVTAYAYAALAALVLVLYLFPRQVIGLFGITGGPMLDMTVTALRLFVPCLPFYLLNKLTITYYQSTEKTTLSGLATSLQNCVAVLPAAFLLVYLARRMGLDLLNALVCAFTVGELATALIVFGFRKWKYRGQGFLLLPEGGGEKSLDLTAGKSVEHAVMVPQEIERFCTENGVDAALANKLAVAAEEMTVNIITYGGPKACAVDINLCITEDELILRIRDDGLPFDPTTYQAEETGYEIHGIELVRKLTGGISYMRTLDFNNTVIRISLEKA